MAQKYTVEWDQEIVSGDYWRVGEERTLTTEQFYFMETTYPGCLVAVKEPAQPAPSPNQDPALRAETLANKRVVTRAPGRNASPRKPKPDVRPPAQKKAR